MEKNIFSEIVNPINKYNSTLKVVPKKEVVEIKTNSKIVQYMLKYSGGIIKNESQAYLIIFSFIFIMILFALYLVFGKTKNEFYPKPKKVAPKIEQVNKKNIPKK